MARTIKDHQFIVGLGEVLWDKFPTGKRLGGAPANFAYHASQFGHEGLVVSAIGLDKDGQDIISELESHSLPYHLDRVSYKTGTVKVDMTDPNSPIYTIRRPVAWDHIPFTDDLREIARNTKAVCYGTLAQRGLESRRTIRLFLDSCPPDCLKICDINLRQSFFNKAIIQESLRRADILKLNEEELSVVTGLLGYGIAGEGNPLDLKEKVPPLEKILNERMLALVAEHLHLPNRWRLENLKFTLPWLRTFECSPRFELK